ncbi:hypothetical protein PHYBOEH_007995 [Phytophthora boehmeriae]|uniref:RxLR effector protein n=1 Tax=Phytophthora boehmeriae TaxID=109152 RepID=A0A8T1W4L3_9STRA|nr:hypothetical protein PHYBOEH_007995 [Phytophthora boehmeriae]
MRACFIVIAAFVTFFAGSEGLSAATDPFQVKRSLRTTPEVSDEYDSADDEERGGRIPNMKWRTQVLKEWDEAEQKAKEVAKQYAEKAQKLKEQLPKSS